ncbi:MAG TPA: cation-transporting P-type ATPase [Longimicrobiaceae bacterium]|nr:cation-transporting P-type ATPase [Longimicrobiaceae bacterium]
MHLPGWSGGGQRSIEVQLRERQGVHRVQANALTGNVLIHFDPAAADETDILAAVRALELDRADAPAEEQTSPPVSVERRKGTGRVRIPVRGLDRDPSLAAIVVERLECHPGVRATPNPLTGRVLVEFSEEEVVLHELLAEVAELELPDLPGEIPPAHPLDRGPLLQSAIPAIGAAIGLGWLAARRLAGSAGPPLGASAPAVAAALIGLVEGFPAVRSRLHRFLGPDTADLMLTGAAIFSLTLSGGALGLILAGAESLRLFTEVRARRAAWRRYEERLEGVASAFPGAVLGLESGDRTPLAARVLEGTGTATGRDGQPVGIAPGERVPAGARLYGGSFVLQLQGDGAFTPQPRPAPIVDSGYERYVEAMAPLSLAYAAATLLLTRSPARAFAALLLVNPRPAVIGVQGADAGASARVLRSGVTVVGTRSDRAVRLPRVLLFDSPRVLTDGFDVGNIIPLAEGYDSAEILRLAAGVAAAAGSPWGSAFKALGAGAATDGLFDGRAAAARIAGADYSLGPVDDEDPLPRSIPLGHRGACLLLLRRGSDRQPLGALVLRPRVSPHLADLVELCGRRGVELGVLASVDPVAAAAVAEHAGVPLLREDGAVEVIRARQKKGARVAFVSDDPESAAAFAACDLAVGITDYRNHFLARADLLAPDLRAVADIIEAGACREAAVRDSIALSIAANGTGAVWGLRSRPGVDRASMVVQVAALGALAAGWLRLQGGERPWSSLSELADPHPERWGRRSIASVLQALNTTESGLTTAQAVERRRAVQPVVRQSGIQTAILDQLRSPLTVILGAGAGLSLFLGETAELIMIGAMLAANVAAGAWQEHQSDQAAEALKRMGTAVARVLRGGRVVTLPASEIVPGDVLLLARGDRVVADARLVNAEGLEVDEAALTGESLPVPKAPTGGADASRVVLEGSDVIAGTGRAVVVAVGPKSRMGAIAAALALEAPQRQSPLTARLSQMLRLVLPIAAAGGGIVALSGLLRRQPLGPQLALGATVALTAVPEGLTLLAAMGEAAVARRLASRNALVHRPSAVEALGRVDVVCTDKTGTLTEGRLALGVVADLDREVSFSSALPTDLRHVLLTAALAGPHPDAPDADADPTDAAVTRAAEVMGLGEALRAEREAKSAFHSALSFHSAVVQGRLCVEGAAEALVPRCSRVLRDGEEHPLDAAGRRELLARARQLGERGLRVLMVAEGTPDNPVDDPQGLVALGLLGIRDPLRPGVPAAVRRCHDAGIRVIMLTGDHPATARVIAREAGLQVHDGDILTGAEIAELEDAELGARLERATVIARATPLDKLRIVESLRRYGHIVAMTGDGVNDAPALRLADVGVAMGRSGTEVARQAADVVLADDDFSTLVEAFVEGRSFWRNIRDALGLLLGGNLAELGFAVGGSVLGAASPLTGHQTLAVNLLTDVLPALAVVLQQPEHHDLAALAREGSSSLDAPLRNEILRRATATAVPSLAAFLIALRSGGVPLARTVAFASIVATQLAQTFDVGGRDGNLTRSVRGVAIGSAGALVGTVMVRPLRAFLELVRLTPWGWALVGAATISAVVLARALAAPIPPAPVLAPGPSGTALA